MNPTQYEVERRSEAAQFRDGLGFHPANTKRIQLAHEAARLLAALMGTHLVHLLPQGREKSLAKTALEDVMMRSNRAIALGKGPHPLVDDDLLAEMVGDLKSILRDLGADLPEDPRIEAYKAEQRGESVDPLAPFEYRREHGEPEHYTQLEIGLTGVAGPEPEVKISVVEHNEAENVTDGAEQWIDDPEVLESVASYLLTMASQLRGLKARVRFDSKPQTDTLPSAG